MKSTKRSVAFLVRGEAGRVLAVRRPLDDEDLPDAWGLPAGSLRPGEGWEEAVRRAGREKLGVTLRPGALLREGELERDAYRLRMRLYGASIEGGEPVVPQPVEGVTQYAEWAWAPPSQLEAAAAKGSLCSRLALEWRDEGG
ncbi:MAG: NUDIX domain-containing protein [Candidatus Palauibacterales bacterium]|nr:NUDIX domain-containing protein [Candidatus Palauibacterales bacterium]MDP2530047.1 NUDIX domain-containing protein [Candidatus Palauibacterales bacterium]MDP2582825.1 NUDIX domain-containing protein [Candidatus Palauibacterales bacterium]